VDALAFVAAVISSLVWPAVLVTLVLVFRKQLTAELQKLEKLSGHVGPFSFESLFRQELATHALAMSPPPIFEETFGGTLPRTFAFRSEPGVHVFSERRVNGDIGIHSGGHGVRDAEPESDKPPYVQLDPEVRSLLITARSIVQSQPRAAVLAAGRALELSIASTLDSLGIPYGVDAKGPNTYVPAIFALRQAGVVDGIQADSLERLYKLYRSAIPDSADEVTASSALQYIMFIENEVGLLALRQEAWLKRGTDDIAP
jgi:hypothetical protein